jgi:hypothetical protein
MPLTDAELNEKFLELTTPVVGDAAARDLLNRLWKLETEKSVDHAPEERLPARVAG